MDMCYINSIKKALNYIENNLQEDIDLSAIAKEAGYSLYHFHRIFKGIVGDSMKDYVRKRINRKCADEIMGICIFSQGDAFDYMIGHEVNTIEYVPEDMVIYRLEPSLYAVFRVIGPITESVQKTWDYIYSVWLSESKYKHRNIDDIEYYYYTEGELVADLYIPIIPY